MPFTGNEKHVTFSAEALCRLNTGLSSRAVHDEHGLPRLVPDVTSALILAHSRGHKHRWFVWRGPEKICGSQSAYAGRAISAVAVDTGGQHTKAA